MTASAAPAARRAARSTPMEALARTGLGASAVVYLLIGLLALFVAFGDNKGEANQNGALQELAQHTGGVLLLVAVAIGLAGYALWQLSIAMLGDPVEGKEAKPRVKGLGSGIVHIGLAITAFTVIFEGKASSQAEQQEGLTAKVMKHDFGRWAVGVAGIVIAIIGIVMIVDGVRRKFEKTFKLDEMSPGARKTVEILGVTGNVARGVVVGVSGVLVLIAAIQFDPNKARGIDGALRALRETPLGPWLLVLVALGLMLFGLFRGCEARWRKVT